MITREIAQKHKKMIETKNVPRNARSCQKVTKQLVESPTRPFRLFKLRELPEKRSYEQKTLTGCEQFTLPGVVGQNNDRLSKR